MATQVMTPIFVQPPDPFEPIQAKPIYSPECETSVLACVLRDPKLYLPLADIITAPDFYWQPYRWAWQSFEDLYLLGQRADSVTLGDQLERMGKLEEFCLPGTKTHYGRAAISGLREMASWNESAEAYAIQVQDYSAKRRLLNFAGQIAFWAQNGRRASDIIADTEQAFGKIILHGKAATYTTGMDIAAVRAYDAIMQAMEGKETGLDTGLVDLDRILGVQKTELITIAGRPGEGKTSLLTTIALNAAKRRKKVLFFTAEMSSLLVTQRLLSQLSNISAYRLMRGKIENGEKELLEDAVDELSNLPLIICDLPSIRIGQIRNEARKQKDLDLILLDYIQLANADTRNDRRDLDIGEITRGLVALAKELDIPILAAAQLNRAVDTRADKMPVLSDLRESGSIEQDSASVVFIHSKDPYGGTGISRPVDLIVAKHRNGPVGTCSLIFNKDTTRFVCTALREMQFMEER